MTRSSILATCVLFAALSQAQRGETPVFRADVDVYTVHVAVVDPAGAPIEDLSADDLEIIENGAVRQVAFVIPAREAALDIAVVLDISSSMATFMPYARADLHAFLDQLAARDCVLFVSFRSEVAHAAWAPPNHSELRALIDVGTGGFTGLFVGLKAALAELAEARTRAIIREIAALSGRSETAEVDRLGSCPAADPTIGGIPSRRRALVLISDGGNTGSDLATEAITLASVAGVPIFAVGAEDDIEYRQPGRPATYDAARDTLPRPPPTLRGSVRLLNADLMRHLAGSTGGAFVSGRDWRLEQILAWLRGTYLVAYHASDATPDSEPGLDFAARTIEVRMSREDAIAIVQPNHYRPTFDPDAGRPALDRGKMLLEAGDPNGALPILETAVAHDPARSEAYFQRALAQAQLGRPRAALASARQATYLDPGVGAAHYLIALLAAEISDYDAAWRELLSAHQAGHEISRLRAHLQTVAPPSELFQEHADATRLVVQLSAAPTDLAQIRAYIEATRAIRRALSREPSVGLVVRPELAEYVLTVTPREYAPDNPRRVSLDLELRSLEGVTNHRGSLSLEGEGASGWDADAVSGLRSFIGRLASDGR